ncbi:hypothetical protein [Thalassobacillus devorans]|uniref:hypothetical protein n=1 Tax=Thalassobacillus devorans TaxID=279813 RepID=UPI000A1C91F8|nr:hypothetical protein [Thalassobacillus devorans]
MKYLLLLVLTAALLLTGCSTPSEVIRVGEPDMEEDGDQGYIVKGHTIVKELENKEDVQQVKQIMKNADKIEEPYNHRDEPHDIFLELYAPDNHVAIQRAYLWYKQEGKAVMMNGDEEYFEVSEGQVETLQHYLSEE